MLNTEQTPKIDAGYQFPAGANPAVSKKITQRLSKGQIISKKAYHAPTSGMKDDKLYNALFNEMDFYREMFVHMGWNLVHSAEGEFFYLSKADEEASVEEGDSNSLRVCVPLFYMADSVIKRGLNPEVLWTPHIGLNADDLLILSQEGDEKQLTMEALKFKGDVWQDAIKSLMNKGFLFENSKGNVVFSSAAKYFVERMIENFAD